MSGGSEPGRRMVWLEGSGVWASLPAERQPSPTKPASGSRRRERRARAAEPDPAAAAQQAGAPRDGSTAADAAAAPAERYTGFGLQQDKGGDSEVEECAPLETCPICLVDVVDLRDKAVASPCMHAFCEPCISRWLGHHKRVCPLCKARVEAVLHDITPAGEYKERPVPPSPKLQTIGSSGGGGGGGGAAEGPLLERLQELLGVPGLRDPYERQQERGRHRLSTQSGSGRVGHGARSAGAVARTQAQAQAQAQGQAAPGPRPYFWRLQQRLQAGAYRPGSGAAGGAWGALQGADGAAAAAPVREEDYVLLWRRQVYDNDLWAVPLGGEAPRLALGSGSARERRLTEWVDRELRALLQSNDTVVLRGFVLGLVVAYGLQPFPPPAAAATTASGGASGPVPAAVGPAGGSSAAASAAAAQAARATASRRAAAMVAAAGGGGGGGGGGALGSSPAEALQPFLHEHAPHFWHELRCFAAAPFNIPTYDRTVQYRRREEPAPAAPGGSRRPSRWDERRPETEGSRPIQPAVVVASGRARQTASLALQAATPPGSSRNPSPPPLHVLLQSGQQQQQRQQQQLADGHRGGSRSRSTHRRRRHRSRSRSRSRSGYRRRSRGRSRERRQGRRSSRSYSRGRRQRRRRSSYAGRRWRSSSGSPGRYLAGADDVGDRWQMA